MSPRRISVRVPEVVLNLEDAAIATHGSASRRSIALEAAGEDEQGRVSENRVGWRSATARGQDPPSRVVKLRAPECMQ